MRIGTVIGYEITENRDAEDKSLMLQVEISGEDDVQTVEYMQASGVDHNPPIGSAVVVNDLGQAWAVAMGADDFVEPESESGEYEIYASDGVTKKSRVKCKVDGVVELNGTADFAVRYSKLEAAFNDLQSKWNTFANAYVPGGPGGIGTPPTAIPSTGDITQAKITEVKVP